MTFLYPKLLWLLLLVPALCAWYIWRGRRLHASLRTPSLAMLAGKRGWRTHLLHLPIVLRMLALVTLVIALARPQSQGAWSEQQAEGIDIMLTMDISTSMLALDFKPTRVEAAKRVAASFVARREHDNIGLVAFSGESFTASPLTTDHAQLLNRLAALYPGMIEDRTAIGLGLVTAINRLRASKAESKVIILLTDGRNNAGDISPQMAADLAQAMGITIYTIGMGTSAESAPVAVLGPFGGLPSIQQMPVDIDEPTLQELASKTGGAYYRATEDESLDRIYKEIDKLEKTKMEIKSYQVMGENFALFVAISLFLLLLEFILRHTLLRTNP